MRKKSALVLMPVLILLGLIAIQSVFAESVPKPSVPEFTVKYVDRSYDVPLEYHTSIDPFTGEQVTTTSGGNHVTNKTIDITIKNQPYSSISLDDEKTISLTYAIRTKGHFADWTPVASGGYSFTRVLASNSAYTVVTLRIGSSDNDLLMDYADVVIREDGQEDFQVNAQAGYTYLTYTGFYPTGSEFEQYAESGWSGTQTITFDATSNTSNPTSTPAVPELPVMAILPLLVIIPLIATALIRKKKVEA